MLSKTNQKVVVLIHGFPEPIYKSTPLYKYFENKDYQIISPYLFSSKFKLTADETVNYIVKLLDGRTPEVIVGVSLGGLLAPHLAKLYPVSKLILIATGPKIKTNIGPLNRIANIREKYLILPILSIVRHCPTWLYAQLYNLVNHPVLNEDEKIILKDHVTKNWTAIVGVSPEEDLEVLDFLTSVDNSVLLHSLKNKTLILTGDGDVMMPVLLSRRLKKLIKKSHLIINKGRLHYSVFTAADTKYFDVFLN
jgi:pimeloyl-ACP methyl ester carboxylesterase